MRSAEKAYADSLEDWDEFDQLTGQDVSVFEATVEAMYNSEVIARARAEESGE